MMPMRIAMASIKPSKRLQYIPVPWNSRRALLSSVLAVITVPLERVQTIHASGPGRHLGSRSVVVSPAPDSMPHGPEQGESEADHNQDDAHGPQDCDGGHQSNDHKDHAEDDHFFSLTAGSFFLRARTLVLRAWAAPRTESRASSPACSTLPAPLSLRPLIINLRSCIRRSARWHSWVTNPVSGA